MSDQVDLLASVPLFSLTSKKDLRKIARQFKLQNVAAGERITEQGKYGREFYVVLSGIASCVVDGREIREFVPGSFFGELALLAGGPRSATITAETPMELLVLDRTDFTTLVRVEPYVAVKIMTSLAARLQQADHQLTN